MLLEWFWEFAPRLKHLIRRKSLYRKSWLLSLSKSLSFWLLAKCDVLNSAVGSIYVYSQAEHVGKLLYQRVVVWWREARGVFRRGPTGANRIFQADNSFDQHQERKTSRQVPQEIEAWENCPQYQKDRQHHNSFSRWAKALDWKVVKG